MKLGFFIFIFIFFALEKYLNNATKTEKNKNYELLLASSEATCDANAWHPLAQAGNKRTLKGLETLKPAP